MEKFRDRFDAGKKLAEELKKYSFKDPLILALLRGGVPVAREIAKALAIPMDIWVVRKIGAPWQPEFSIGAIAEGGHIWLAAETIEEMGITESELNALIEGKKLEMKERIFFYRGLHQRPTISGRTIILVDDGIATGATMCAAAGAVREEKPLEIVLAVPVAASDALSFLRTVTDREISLLCPENLVAVGAWYEDFSQVSDEEVLSMLKS
ncbi:MAG TPA: phosphoribosyltransferase family protein [Chitinispirillaceae bacterium]|nr:phosphoribosyltransferase family protein [Chitinispirillaceae bacterium]